MELLLLNEDQGKPDSVLVEYSFSPEDPEDQRHTNALYARDNTF